MRSANSSGPPQGATENIHVAPTIDQPQIPAASGACTFMINVKVRLMLSSSQGGDELCCVWKSLQNETPALSFIVEIGIPTR